MVDTRARGAFWDVVEDCLVTFHHFSSEAARRHSGQARQRIDALGTSGDLFYHSEPFHVASDIAGNELAIAPHEEAYDVILKRHGW